MCARVIPGLGKTSNDLVHARALLNHGKVKRPIVRRHVRLVLLLEVHGAGRVGQQVPRVAGGRGARQREMNRVALRGRENKVQQQQYASAMRARGGGGVAIKNPREI